MGLDIGSRADFWLPAQILVHLHGIARVGILDVQRADGLSRSPHVGRLSHRFQSSFFHLCLCRHRQRRNHGGTRAQAQASSFFVKFQWTLLSLSNAAATAVSGWFSGKDPARRVCFVDDLSCHGPAAADHGVVGFSVLFGLATIPAFMIPLPIPGEVVKLKSAGMSYTFMVLSNVIHTFEGLLEAFFTGSLLCRRHRRC